jgi:hypothetical protein
MIKIIFGTIGLLIGWYSLYQIITIHNTSIEVALQLLIAMMLMLPHMIDIFKNKVTVNL